MRTIGLLARLVMALALGALAGCATKRDSATSAGGHVASASNANDRAAAHDQAILSNSERQEYKNALSARWQELQRR